MSKILLFSSICFLSYAHPRYMKCLLTIMQEQQSMLKSSLHFKKIQTSRVNNSIILRSCSLFMDRSRSETIFVTDRCRVHTALMLFVTQIGTILLCSKKWSETIQEWILQNVNNMKRNHDAGKSNSKCQSHEISY